MAGGESKSKMSIAQVQGLNNSSWFFIPALTLGAFCPTVFRSWLDYYWSGRG